MDGAQFLQIICRIIFPNLSFFGKPKLLFSQVFLASVDTTLYGIHHMKKNKTENPSKDALGKTDKRLDLTRLD